MKDMELLLQNYRLTTAEILYHMPDHPDLLQSYLWQEYDQCPDFPILHKFLHFWEHKLDGKLHSVNVASCEIISPSDFSHIQGEFRLN